MSILRSLGPLLVLVALATPARADKYDKHDWSGHHGKHDHSPPPMAAPEIDPGTMLGGLTLLTGGALILADRRRHRAVGPQLSPLGAD